MKKLILLLVLGAFLLPTLEATESTGTQGSKFFFSFMLARPKQAKQLELIISSPVAGIAKFTSSKKLSSTQPIKAGITKILLAQMSGSFNDVSDSSYSGNANILGGLYKDCYVTLPNLVQKEGYMVETFLADGVTPLQVSMYAGLSSTSTSDCANIYPIDALGNEYYVISRFGNSVGNDFVGTSNQQYNSAYYPSETAIVGVEDSTQIDIYPSCLIYGQAATDTKYSKIHITLNRGETYLIKALTSDSTIGSNDLTGTRIVATNDGSLSGNTCKKFAVFSGSQHGSGLNSPYLNGDYEYDELFPVHLWGTDYIAGSTTKGLVDDACIKRKGRDEIRVVASQPLTELYVNNAHVATLNQGEFYSRKDTADEGTYIHASKPVEVGLFTTGENMLCTNSSANGGPALAVLAPLQQYLRSVTFPVYDARYSATASNVIQHSVMITSLTSIRDSTYINGVQLKNGATITTPIVKTSQTVAWVTLASNPKYSQLTIVDVDTACAYTLVNTASADTIGGFTAFVFSSQGKNTGYAYSIGASASLINDVALQINGIASTTIKASTVLDKTITCTPVIPSGIHAGKISWYFSNAGSKEDTVTTSTNNFIATHTYSSTGTQSVRMIVYKDSVNCFYSITPDTIDVQFSIPTGTQYKNIKAEKISVYPNPSSDNILISGFNGVADVIISDVNGQKVSSYSVSENTTIPIRQLEKGIYLLQVKTGQQSETIKFIKK